MGRRHDLSRRDSPIIGRNTALKPHRESPFSQFIIDRRSEQPVHKDPAPEDNIPATATQPVLGLLDHLGRRAGNRFME